MDLYHNNRADNVSCALGAPAALAEASERQERGVPPDVYDVSADQGCA